MIDLWTMDRLCVLGPNGRVGGQRNGQWKLRSNAFQFPSLAVWGWTVNPFTRDRPSSVPCVAVFILHGHIRTVKRNMSMYYVVAGCRIRSPLPKHQTQADQPIEGGKDWVSSKTLIIYNLSLGVNFGMHVIQKKKKERKEKNERGRYRKRRLRAPNPKIFFFFFLTRSSSTKSQKKM